MIYELENEFMYNIYIEYLLKYYTNILIFFYIINRLLNKI